MQKTLQKISIHIIFTKYFKDMEETEKTINQILNKALEVAEKTGEFVIEQAPLLLQEFYAWHTASAIIIAIFCLFPLPIFIYYFKKAKWEYLESFEEIAAIVLGSICFIGIPIAFVSLHDLVFITVAPKLYLIEYFTK